MGERRSIAAQLMKIIEMDADSDASASGDSSNKDLVDVAILKRAYVSKDDIVEAVAKYHAQVLRPFKVAKSDKRRYKMVCPIDECTFLAQFAFTSSFDRPPNLSPHTCSLDSSVQAAKRLSTAKDLAGNTELRECFFADRAEAHFARDDTAKSPDTRTSSVVYELSLNVRGHKSTCEVANGTFVRLAIVYREGIQAFSQYSDRGLSVDGTFLRTVTGDALLVACFRNGNLQLQIVAVAVVSIENQDNWDFFLRFLVASLKTHPHFLISDRDKGLVLAVAALATIKNHFFYFRHLMENFNRQFKSKALKNAAWTLALAVSEAEFAIKATILKRMNPEAEAWLMSVGEDKRSLCYSSCPRYGTLTSNNVESVNAVLKNIWKLPILDCLMAIERYVHPFP